MELITKTPEKKKLSLFLDAATQIGDHLVRTALWDNSGSYCNWLSRKDIMDRQLAAYSNTNGAVTPELYSGSAGIAWFLMELYRSTGNEAYKQTALGGWLRSVKYIQEVGIPASPISFYAGDLGLLYIGYRFIEIDTVTENILAPYLSYLIKKTKKGLSIKHGIDIIGGNAGAIAPLFRLAEEHDLPSLALLGIACADEILQLATWKDGLCYWDSPKVLGTEMDHPPLTGYSHGCSGIAAALMIAYQYTGKREYLLHARGAFAFEHTLFNEDENNWIDTRYPHYKKDGKIYGAFRSAWCHGAPGNVLAHIVAGKIDHGRNGYHKDIAQRAITTTRKFLTEKLEPNNDATLCHGYLGLTDILFTYAEHTNDSKLKKEARAFAEKYLNLHPQPADMTSGIIAGGYSPSLLIGMSGVGLHYLRLHADQHVPSALFSFQ